MIKTSSSNLAVPISGMVTLGSIQRIIPGLSIVSLSGRKMGFPPLLYLWSGQRASLEPSSLS
ncbi:MAG: hypothetical protein QXH53_07325 [Nitrososphaerales archaeon]